MRSEGLLRSLLILAVTAALTIIVIDLAIASKPALMGTHVGLGGKGRGGAEGSATPSYGKVYEVMVRDNARALQYASTPGAVGAGEGESVSKTCVFEKLNVLLVCISIID